MTLMHQINLDPNIVERVKQRRGRLHAYESLESTSVLPPIGDVFKVKSVFTAFTSGVDGIAEAT